MANDNIYPDQSGGIYDIKYAQLRILASDIRRNFSQGQGQGSPGDGETGDPGTGGVGDCVRYMNVGTEVAAGVSYVDCDGILQAGVTIQPMQNFCAQEITNFGTCSNIVQEVGPCEVCDPCCAPTINSITVITQAAPGASKSINFVNDSSYDVTIENSIGDTAFAAGGNTTALLMYEDNPWFIVTGPDLDGGLVDFGYLSGGVGGTFTGTNGNSSSYQQLLNGVTANADDYASTDTFRAVND